MEKYKNGELPVVLSSDVLLDAIAKAEKRIDAIIKMKQIALKVTNEHDWIDQAGKPYLQVSGSEKVGRLFEISWQLDSAEPDCEQLEGGHYLMTYRGTFTMGNVTIEAIGMRSSKDGFFKRYEYIEIGGGKKEKRELPTSEIDKRDVKMSAYTNWLGNGITRLLGIRNLTYADLQAAGINIDKIQKVEYKKEEMSEDGKDVREKCRLLLKELYGDNYSAQLESLTEFIAADGKKVAGKKTLDGLTEKALNFTYAKVKIIYNKEKGKTKEDSVQEKQVEGEKKQESQPPQTPAGQTTPSTPPETSKPKLKAEQFIHLLKTCKNVAGIERAWNQYFSNLYTDLEKAMLLEWKEKLLGEMK